MCSVIWEINICSGFFFGFFSRQLNSPLISNEIWDRFWPSQPANQPVLLWVMKVWAVTRLVLIEASHNANYLYALSLLFVLLYVSIVPPGFLLRRWVQRSVASYSRCIAWENVRGLNVGRAGRITIIVAYLVFPQISIWDMLSCTDMSFYHCQGLYIDNTCIRQV